MTNQYRMQRRIRGLDLIRDDKNKLTTQYQRDQTKRRGNLEHFLRKQFGETYQR